ncbi:MAG: mitochondral 37S ribosomal protein S27 [Cirrosporium novae-zelandiae]|nr:MAG: mitochondral 37S ribosomal protein S27 [Cirrosporium novae-zelandiae]
MAVPRARILDLMKIQCRIFNTTFNPEGLRLGNKVLRQRLRGPALASYYPRRTVTLKDLKKAFPDFTVWDDDEEDRLESIAITKMRGKGPPKKKRTADESKKLQKKKKSSTPKPVVF